MKPSAAQPVATEIAAQPLPPVVAHSRSMTVQLPEPNHFQASPPIFGHVRLRDLALFYQSLAAMLDAGVPIVRALDSTAKSTSNPTLRRAIAHLCKDIEHGGTLTESMADQLKVFPSLHIKLLAVAEKSGRINVVLRELADYVEQLIAIRRVVFSGLILPAIILHLAAFIVPAPTFVIGYFGGQGSSLGMYLLQSLGFLGVVWAVVIGCVLTVRAMMRSTAGRATLDSILRGIPVAGRTWRELDYWRLTSGVEMLTNAGLGVVQSVRLCAGFCRSPKIARALERAADSAETGGTVSGSLADSREFPDEMVAMWATGEETGRLDDMLARLAKTFAERAQMKMRELARWLPWLAYIAVSIYVIINIFILALGYVAMLNSFM